MIDGDIVALNAANAAAYDVLQDTLKTAHEVERAARAEAYRVYDESKKLKGHEPEEYHVLNIWKIG